MFGKKGVEGANWFVILFVLALLIFAVVMVFPMLLKKTANQLFEAKIFSDLAQDDNIIVVSTPEHIDQEAIAPRTQFMFRPEKGINIPNPSAIFEKQSTGKGWSLIYFYFCDIGVDDYSKAGIEAPENVATVCSKSIEQDDLDYLLAQPSVQGTLVLDKLTFTRVGKEFNADYRDNEGVRLTPEELAAVITKHFYNQEIQESEEQEALS